MGSAFRGRDGVAIGMAKAVLVVLRPRDCPFDAAALGKIDTPEKWPRRQHRTPVEARREEIAKPAREMQPSLGRDAVGPMQCWIAGPANLQTAEEIGLRPCHAVERRRAKSDVAEDLGVRVEPQGSAAPVVYRSAVDEPRLRHTTAVALAPQSPVPRHLDLETVGECINDGHPNAVQTSRGAVW